MKKLKLHETRHLSSKPCRAAEIKRLKDLKARRERSLKLKYAPEGGVLDYIESTEGSIACACEKLRQAQIYGITKQTIYKWRRVNCRPKRKSLELLADGLSYTVSQKEAILRRGGYSAEKHIDTAGFVKAVLERNNNVDIMPISKQAKAKIIICKYAIDIGFSRQAVDRALADPLKASRDVIIHMVIGLRLDEDDAIKLLKKAGIILTKTYPEDVIYRKYLAKAANLSVLFSDLIRDLNTDLIIAAREPRGKRLSGI